MENTGSNEFNTPSEQSTKDLFSDVYEYVPHDDDLSSSSQESQTEAVLEAMDDVNYECSHAVQIITTEEMKMPKKGAVKHNSAYFRYYIHCDQQQIKACRSAFCSLYQIGRKIYDLIKPHVQRELSAHLLINVGIIKTCHLK
ncbi:hypothetical protein PR048_006348 [Dryococelus australis]|uniref:Uncharacterized protein n=1 Tax=Dryococelus australis TaxID=614101 RepID=A0ABQ9IAQ0_9NEOP|nr:hypothetical protein PR048_006348 [Dryococelus australis]